MRVSLSLGSWQNSSVFVVLLRILPIWLAYWVFGWIDRCFNVGNIRTKEGPGPYLGHGIPTQEVVSEMFFGPWAILYGK